MAITGTPITRLGAYGGARQIYGDFTRAADTTPAAPVDTQKSGGWIYLWQGELKRRKDDEEKRRKERERALAIKDKLDRELALAERKIESETARRAELARVNRIAAQYRRDIIATYPETERALTESLERQTFSTMERMEREINRAREEEEFLMQAAYILVNQ